MSMSDSSLPSPGTFPRVRRPLYPRLVPAAYAFFAATLLSDVAYWRSLTSTWETFSIWLITGGLVVVGVVALLGLIDLATGRWRAQGAPAWPHVLGDALAAVLAIVNAFVHSRDGYTAVVPTGLILSLLVLLVPAVARLYRRSTPTVWPVVPGRSAASGRASEAEQAGAAQNYVGVGDATLAGGSQAGRSRAEMAPAGMAARRGALAPVLSLAGFGIGLGSVWAFSGPAAAMIDPSTQLGAHPELPTPHHFLVPPMDIATVAQWGQDTPSVPAGLKVEALASGFVHPRSVYPLPNGDVLVVESSGPKAPVNRPKDLVMGFVESFSGSKAPGANRITLLRPGAGEGGGMLRTVFIDHLASPFGVALVGHDLYVADTDAILRFPYAGGETSISTPGVRLTGLPGGPIDHHWTKSLVASPDGSKLYVGVGSNSNITENGIGAELDRAAILEVDRSNGAYRVFAGGLRNPNGLQFEPTSGKLWAVVNERDELGPNLVPDYMTSVQDGGFYGWPYSYYGQHVDPRVMPQRPDLVAQAIVPDYALSSHVAPLGMVFTAHSAMPAAFQQGAFVGEHGSWDRTPLNGYKVVYVPFTDGKPAGAAQDVVTGFIDVQGHARGRPVGLAMDHDGALLVADDLGNTVWKVSASGG